MAMTMEHKGYIGAIDYDPDGRVFHGRVINTRDVITFEGRSVDALERALARSVDDYLEMCAEDGVEPEKPLSGKFIVRIDPSLHREVAALAVKEGKSINAVVKEAIAEYVSDHES